MDTEDSNKLKTLLKYLVFLNISMWVFLIITSFIETGISEVEKDLLSFSGFKAKIAIDVYFYWVYIIVWVFLPLLLLTYKNVFRIGFLCFAFLSLILVYFMGYVISSPLEDLLASIMCLSEGAIILLLYDLLLGKEFN